MLEYTYKYKYRYYEGRCQTNLVNGRVSNACGRSGAKHDMPVASQCYVRCSSTFNYIESKVKRSLLFYVLPIVLNISQVYSSWKNLQTHTTLLSVTLYELDINSCMGRQWLLHLMVSLGAAARLPQ